LDNAAQLDGNVPCRFEQPMIVLQKQPQIRKWLGDFHKYYRSSQQGQALCCVSSIQSTAAITILQTAAAISAFENIETFQ
jgi:hypothetical protein